MKTLKYWLLWGKWWRLPSYVFLAFPYLLREQFTCPCVDGSNDYYWNGWFRSPKGCDCGG